VVVTTDDAIITAKKNKELLGSEFVVYLKVNTPTQLERMSNGSSALLPITDQKAFLDKLHQERISYLMKWPS